MLVEPGVAAVLPAVRQFAAPGEAGLHEALPQPAALAEPEQEILLQLFVDAGNADEEGRRDLADVERDGIDQFRKADGAAQHQLHHLAIAALGYMAERQVAHRFERLVGDPDRLGIDIRRIDQVAMRQHRALGRTGGARGVDEDADIVGRGLRNQPIEPVIGVGVFERVALAAFAELFERHQLRLAVMPQALHVDANDGLQRRQAVIVGDGVKHLVGLLLVAGNDHARAGVADDILQLDPGIGRIDADRDRADHLGAEIGVKPFRRILAGDGDAVAGFEAERQQAERDGTRGLVIMVPGIAIPDAEILLAQRELVAMQFGALSKQLRNGDRGILQRGPQRRGVGGGRALGRTRLHSRMRCSHGVEGRHHAPTFASASARWPPR